MSRRPIPGQHPDPDVRLAAVWGMTICLTEAAKMARAGGAVQTLPKIHRALSSAKGAMRHAKNRASNARRSQGAA